MRRVAQIRREWVASAYFSRSAMLGVMRYIDALTLSQL
jgi:hypothetical protein